MSNKILLFCLCIIFSLGLAAQTPTVPSANSYIFKNYFGYTELPEITEEEKRKLINWAIEKGTINRAIMENGDTSLVPLYFYLRDIRNQYNLEWVEKLRKEKEKWNFQGVDYTRFYNILLADAVVKGRVVDIQSASLANPTLCLRYVTEMVIEVLDVVHSYPDIQVGDYILIREWGYGYAGRGCDSLGGDVIDPNAPRKQFITSHISIYGVGDESYFKFHHHSQYQTFFYTLKAIKKSNIQENKMWDYDDVYDPCSFVLGFSSQEFSTSIEKDIDKIKEFLKTVVYEK